ncbi:signal recognition particle-docking protein FtsY [Helicobacter ailurogastricus]|uniref:Signal recognition particle receptor FtsY n=1 Tax=Helicobacter ailurogastricus TaxID=1578720 RepID=A0A0K2X8Y8_9HELI|nr:signal recognition particle-docking protein FtsY [Helicobacter ailurogastricus]GMB90380.1 Signal recognition particle-docking protein FtsY [Helicobacter ailurogastricus]CRF40396.1 Signal recognition particle receptor protein FtsY (=alpha subunit) (TC 3.A.5.1.1) [Helicobacter ailurogastricus]CRF42541.1 Signal recognition particle receptor protein FtsY (=alpha subunit) (TC 3.A.5.1.1) [Helicobacter ailurogastricus]CRF44511.1 Signal recognition particle receptor protein FtsY (=alpha subunit) (TC
MFNFFKKTIQNVASLLKSKDATFSKEEMEEILIGFDVQFDLVEKLLEHLPEQIKRNHLEVALMRFLRKESYYDQVRLKPLDTKPLVSLILGVNGAGKTTTIAKLAKKHLLNNQRVLLGAGDTFRAAAVKQLQLWGEKLQLEVISAGQNSDPSALAFNTIEAGIARGMDQIIIDTAGRLHNQTNLKNELLKISRVCSKALNNAPYYKILILDGTQGSSALEQAKIFHESLELDGVIVTKLDGTSKGGCILSILYELQLPILYLGVGEKENDLIAFEEMEYVKSLLDAIFKDGKED